MQAQTVKLMEDKMKVFILGPAHPLRGGLTTFNHRLAKAFLDTGDACTIYSFSLQYPSFLFPGTSQYTDDPPPENIEIVSAINSINPLNWIKTGLNIKKAKPDIILVRFWIPFMGPALGTILRLVRKNRHTRIIGLTDNVIPHEKRPGDTLFTKFFLGSCHAFITMSEKVMSDLRQFEKHKPAIQVAHPLYDNFGEAVPRKSSREFLGISQNEKIILFFGFIRKYKGLDLLLRAMADERIQASGIKLLVAGEFYDDQNTYDSLIAQLNIEEQLILRTAFIPDHEVIHYFCASDLVVQPYRNATQSGVTPLAYHFEKPMVVTRVGGLPAMVPDMQAGLVAEVDPTSIADAILKFFALGEDFFIPHLRAEKKKLSWSVLVDSIKSLSRS